MEYPSIRFVFDRKKVASKDRKGLVQIEVCSERKRKWIGTGVKVYADQWDDKKKVVKSTQAVQLNTRLDSMMSKLLDYINSLIQKKLPFDFESLELFLKNSSDNSSYIEFLKRRIEERNDFSEGTRRHHRILPKALEEFGRIRYFHDLTKANIVLFDEFLRGKGIKDTTLYNYHKINKTYINEAIRFGLMADNPYAGVKINRGKSEKRKYLTPEEVKAFQDCEIPDEKVSRIRDLFLFQCYTGLSYSDLYKFRFDTDVEVREGKYVIADRRLKTNEDYFIVLLSPAVAILQKYDFKLFKPCAHSRELLTDGTDTHCHLLPGVDDGAPDLSASLDIIRELSKRGIRRICCTPHIMLRYPQNTPEKLQANFHSFCNTIREQLGEDSISLHLAAEYMIDEGFATAIHAEGAPLSLPGERVLIELPQYLLPDGWLDSLLSVRELGCTPVLAHPERYQRLLSIEDISDLTRQGIELQGNIGSLTGFYGRHIRERAEELRQRQLYSYWGSDAHSASMVRRLRLKP